MRTGTLRELDTVIGLLRRFELHDGEADILVHDIARRLAELRPLLRNGKPAALRLEVEFADRDPALEDVMVEAVEFDPPTRVAASGRA